MRTFLVRTPDLTPIFMDMPRSVETRLNGTCFRGRSVAKAGNFFRYGDYTDFIGDMEITIRLIKFCREAVLFNGDKPKFHLRASFTLKDYVGWNSTTDAGMFRADELETFPLNKRVTAKRVIDRSIEAPLTKTITLAMTFKRVPLAWLVMPMTIYPGEDVGELHPSGGQEDITERERRVFFDWNQPGEPVYL